MANPNVGSSEGKRSYEVVQRWDLRPLERIMGEKAAHPQEFISDFIENSHLVGVGSEGDVYRSADSRFRHLCVKKVARSSPRSVFNPGILSEMQRQYDVSKIVDSERAQGKDLAKIPVPVLAFRDTEGNEAYILMEYVPGKTLWKLILEQVVGGLHESDLGGYGRQDLLEMEDDQLGEAIQRILRLPQFGHELKQVGALMARLAKEKPFIEGKFFDQLENTIRTLNGLGFHHRDLHLRNVMISADAIWMIDFGYSLFDPDHIEGNPYEVAGLGQNLSFSRDTGILDLLRPISKRGEEKIQAEASQHLAREKLSAERMIKALAERHRSKIQDMIQASESQMDPAQFVRQVASEQVFGKAVLDAIARSDIDSVVNYAKILAFLEYGRYKTVEGTLGYMGELLSSRRPDRFVNYYKRIETELSPYKA